MEGKEARKQKQVEHRDVCVEQVLWKREPMCVFAPLADENQQHWQLGASLPHKASRLERCVYVMEGWKQRKKTRQDQGEKSLNTLLWLLWMVQVLKAEVAVV